MKKLIIKDMSFKFNKQQNYFFHNANVTFESGKIYFVEGKNGVGKSTFFSILQGTIPCDAVLSGSVIFDGKQYTLQKNCMDPVLSSQIKTMYQDVNKMVVNSMTVAENLQLAQLPHYPRLIPLSDSSLAPRVMGDFVIDHTAVVQRLSGGQKQILAIMMALQKPTQVLLLDEPTAALDEKNTHIVIQFLKTIAQKLDLIIVIITHDTELTHTYAENGKVIIKTADQDMRTIELLS
jgi:putative tryptophan/tyrosine transport system ATP-binding protein